MELTLIQSKIHIIRGYKVMLDYDLASIYGTLTKVLNQAVKRNIKRFPHDFMFQLTKEEFTNLRSQFVTSNRGGTRYLPNAFTVHGVVMLSNVLQSEKAIETSIVVVRAFNTMGEVLLNTSVSAYEMRAMQYDLHRLKEYVEESFAAIDNINEETLARFELISEVLSELQSKNDLSNEPRTRIGFRQAYQQEAVADRQAKVELN